MRDLGTGDLTVLARVYRHSLARFGFFGALGLAFDVCLLWLLVEFTPMPQAVAVTLAFGVTYLLNFFLNRRFSFAAGGRAWAQLVRFTPQVSVDYVLMLTAVQVLTGLGIGLMVARILAGATNAAFNYSMYRWWTFRPRRVVERFDATPAESLVASGLLPSPRGVAVEESPV